MRIASTLIRTSLVALLLGALGLGSAQGAEPAQHAATKKKPAAPNPAMQPVTDVPTLPRVLLIGDSISIGYTLPVRALLRGAANVHRPPTNCGDTKQGLKAIDAWLGTNAWAVIHFNFGLHDLKWVDPAGKYVPPEQGKQVNPLPVYEQNLRELVARLKKTEAKLIWGSTTPVPDGSAGRVKGAELEYNRVAAKIMQENGVAVDDLHALAAAHQEQIQLPRNVHFTSAGYDELAAQVAASIRQQLAP